MKTGRYANQEHDVARDREAEEREKTLEIEERFEERVRDGWQRSGGGDDD